MSVELWTTVYRKTGYVEVLANGQLHETEVGGLGARLAAGSVACRTPDAHLQEWLGGR